MITILEDDTMSKNAAGLWATGKERKKKAGTWMQ
jgi:hypothetical protein